MDRVWEEAWEPIPAAHHQHADQQGASRQARRGGRLGQVGIARAARSWQLRHPARPAPVEPIALALAFGVPAPQQVTLLQPFALPCS